MADLEDPLLPPAPITAPSTMPPSGSVDSPSVAETDVAADGIDDKPEGHPRRRSSVADRIRASVVTAAVRHESLNLRHATWAAFLCVFCDAINLQCCAANYPSMVTQGGPGAFPSTAPFEFAAAHYVISGATNLALVVSSVAFGYLSGRVLGARRSFLMLMGMSAVLTVGKYFARGSFWAFTALCFANGLFGASAGVASGYMTVLYRGDRAKVDANVGIVMATMVVGRSLGGLFAVFFAGNLFLPLLPAAGLNVVALGVAFKFVLDPDTLFEARDEEVVPDGAPASFRVRALFNVVVGAMLDNVGSLAIIPLGLSPMMYKAFLSGPVEKGRDPIMTENGYRWLYSLIAVMAVPPALVTPMLYKKIGVALSCVIANLMTAVVIVALLFTADIEPATGGSFALYACILYLGVPFILVSNFTTGPMLDRLAPAEKKIMVQGCNVAIFNCMGAVFSVVLGMVADANGNSYVMWVCFWISIAAAVVNLPLVFDSALGKHTADEEGETAGRRPSIVALENVGAVGRLSIGGGVRAAPL